MNRFRLSFILIAITYGLGVTSCNNQGTDSNQFFRYNQADGLETLDPAFARNLAIMWSVNFIYNTLVNVDSANQIQPSLAKSWDISEDGLQFTFHLRTDVYFHDNPVFENGKGRKMTADDVVYSFQRLIQPEVASSGAWIFNGRVAEKNPFVALNDSTFILNLSLPFQPMIGILSMPYCSVVPHEVVEKWGKDFRNHPCGTGPFQMAYWDEGNVLMLHKNPNYWETGETGERLPYLKGVQVSFNDLRAMEFLHFKQNELDFMNGIDGAMQDLILTKEGKLRSQFKDRIQLKKSVYLNTDYLGFLLDTTADGNDKDNPLRNLKVRQAINYAIDRQKIITYFRNGVGIPAHHGFIPPGVSGFSKDLKGYSYRPDTVLSLLEEAGYPNGKGMPTIELSTPDAHLEISTYIAKELSNAGIPTKVQVMQKGLLQQQMSGSKLAFFKAQWIADYPDAETFLAFFYSPLPAPPNYTRFNHQYYDKLYEKSMQEKKDSLRHAYYQQMDSFVVAQAPLIPLFYGEILHFTQKNVEGLNSNSLNLINLNRVRKN